MEGSREGRAAARAAVVTCVLGLMAGGCLDARKASSTESPSPAASVDVGGEGTRAKADDEDKKTPTALPTATAATAAAGAPKAGAGGPVTGTLGHAAGGDRSGFGATLAPTPFASTAAPPAYAPSTGVRPQMAQASQTPSPAFRPPTPPPMEAPAPVAKLDPNARYATTYRPGGAALAAFDAAVARGQIPSTYKDLVGDFGARYAPALARPADGALSVAVDTQRTAASPSGGAMNLRVSLVSSEEMPSRAPLSVHIVLDTSGSMSGRAIDDARKAAEAVVGKLAYDDDFSMVTFSDTAHVLVGEGAIGPRRSDVIARIEKVDADGGTNISSGLDAGYAEAHDARIAPDAVRIVMLLSDGHANGGDTSPDGLADRASRAFQDGIQTSSFGLGPDFDASLMSRIADRGAGGYYYLADTSQIAPALSREIDARLQPVATALELRVRLRPDVGATKVFGSRALTGADAAIVRGQEVTIDNQEAKNGIRRDRQSGAEGGMRFFIPAFARADRHSTMITLDLPPGTGERSVASVELRYKDRLLHKNVTREVPVKIRYAESDAASAQTEDPSVTRMALAFAAGETILSAAARVDAGDRNGAAAMLGERADVLRQAADTLHEPMLVEDGARLSRLATAVGREGGVSDPLPLAVMLRGSGYGYL